MKVQVADFVWYYNETFQMVMREFKITLDFSYTRFLLPKGLFLHSIFQLHRIPDQKMNLKKYFYFHMTANDRADREIIVLMLSHVK